MSPARHASHTEVSCRFLRYPNFFEEAPRDWTLYLGVNYSSNALIVFLSVSLTYEMCNWKQELLFVTIFGGSVEALLSKLYQLVRKTEGWNKKWLWDWGFSRGEENGNEESPVSKLWLNNYLPREDVDTPSMEAFKVRLDVAPGSQV